jgi:lysophospholipase L1-like esterase
MNTNPAAKTILCFGDSNTYGTKPDQSGRWPADVRWTGVLQNNLGNAYYVIEEGLGGRNTDMEHYDPKKTTRNGFTYFQGCLESHLPLDLIIIMLGTNDLKKTYNKSVNDIANSLESYVNYAKAFISERPYFHLPAFILISPPYINSKAKNFSSGNPSLDAYDEKSADKSRMLAPAINKVIDKLGIGFVDAGPLTSVGDDGLHFDSKSHRILGNELSSLIKESL